MKITFSENKPYKEGLYLCRFKDKTYEKCIYILRICHNLNNHDWIFLNGDSRRLGSLREMEYSKALEIE